MAAARDENFGTAANRLNIVQSAFSRNIAELESELGVKLFDRVGRGVRLSAAGARYAEQVADILRRLDQANDEMRRYANKETTTVKIGLLDFTGLQERIIDVLRVLRKGLPEVEITLSPLGSVEQIRRIEAGMIDAGFICNWSTSSEYLDRFNVSNDHWQLALSEDHYLAAAGKITLQSLDGVPFVSISPDISPFNFKRLVGECATRNFEPKIIQFAASTNGVMALVAAGVGVCFVTALVRPPPGVIFREIEGFDVEVPLDFVWRRHEERPEIIKTVKTIVLALSESR